MFADAPDTDNNNPEDNCPIEDYTVENLVSAPELGNKQKEDNDMDLQ